MNPALSSGLPAAAAVSDALAFDGVQDGFSADTGAFAAGSTMNYDILSRQDPALLA